MLKSAPKAAKTTRCSGRTLRPCRRRRHRLRRGPDRRRRRRRRSRRRRRLRRRRRRRRRQTHRRRCRRHGHTQTSSATRTDAPLSQTRMISTIPIVVDPTFISIRCVDGLIQATRPASGRRMVRGTVRPSTSAAEAKRARFRTPRAARGNSLASTPLHKQSYCATNWMDAAGLPASFQDQAQIPRVPAAVTQTRSATETSGAASSKKPTFNSQAACSKENTCATTKEARSTTAKTVAPGRDVDVLKKTPTRWSMSRRRLWRPQHGSCPSRRPGTRRTHHWKALSRLAKAPASQRTPMRDCGSRAAGMGGTRGLSTVAPPCAPAMPIAWPMRSTATTTTTAATGMRTGGTSTRTLDRAPSTAPRALATRTRKRGPNTIQPARTRRRRGATQSRSSCPTRRRRAARATSTRRRATWSTACTRQRMRSGRRSTPTMPTFSSFNSPLRTVAMATPQSRRARGAPSNLLEAQDTPSSATSYTRTTWQTPATAPVPTT